jgi:hypothetical protein
MSVVSLLASTNGVTHGRVVSPLNSFTVPSSGITLTYHKVSPIVIGSIRQAVEKETRQEGHAHPCPAPPTAAVDYGEGVIKQEALPESAWDDTYRTQKAQWEEWVGGEAGNRYIRMLILRYIVFSPDDLRAMTEEVEILRSALEDVGSAMPDISVDPATLTAEEQTKLYFIFGCCFINPFADSQAFMAHVVGKSQPREEAVADRIAAFRTAAE